VLALGVEIESNLIAAGVGAGTFGSALLLPHLVRPAGMGFGDVKFSLLLGFAVGWAAGAPIHAVVGVGWALVASSAVGLMVAASSRPRGRESVGRNGVVPFGPSLTLGSLTVALAMVAG
jgi:leader peptidase (prepilin peptidase)/N-methyltransferase